MRVKVIGFILLLYCTGAESQEPAFYINEGLINDGAVILESQNVMVCSPGNESGYVIDIGDRITAWDIATGMVIKNIPVGNNHVWEIRASRTEKYLVVRMQDNFSIYETNAYELVRSIPISQNGSAFCHIVESPAMAYVCEGSSSFKYDLSDSTRIPVPMENDLTFYDWAEQRISHDNIMYVPGADTIKMIDLKTGQQAGYLLTSKIFNTGDKPDEVSLAFPLQNSNHILFRTRKYSQLPNLVLFDLSRQKILSTIPVPFEDYDYMLDQQGNLIITADRNNKTSYERGYTIMHVRTADGILKPTVRHLSIKSPFSYSITDEVWKYGIYVLRENNLGMIFIVDCNTGKQYELKNRGSLPRINVISENLVLAGNKESKVSGIIDLNTGKEHLFSEDKEQQLITFFNQLGKSSFNVLVRQNKYDYNFYKWKPGNNRSIAYSFRNTSIKVIPHLKSKVGKTLHCQLLNGGLDGMSISLSKTARAGELVFNMNTGSVDIKTKTINRPGAYEIAETTTGGNVYCKIRVSKGAGWFGSDMADSLFFYDKEHELLAALSSVDFHKLTGDYQPGPEKFCLSPSGHHMLVMSGGNDSIVQLEFRKGEAVVMNKVAEASYPSLQFAYCNNGKNFYQIGDSLLHIYDATTAQLLRSIPGRFQPDQVNVSGEGIIATDSRSRTISIGSINETKPFKTISWRNRDWIFNDMVLGASPFQEMAFTYEATGDLEFIDLKTGKSVYHETGVLGKPGAFVNINEFIFFNSSGLPVLINFKTKVKSVFQSNVPVSESFSFRYDPADKLLISSCKNNLFVWDVTARSLKYNLIISDTTHYFLQDNHGYYKYDKIEAGRVICRIGRELTYPQQLDLIYNRPDKFAEDSITAGFLRNLYMKRLDYNGVKIGALKKENILKRPRCSIIKLEHDTVNVIRTEEYRIRLHVKSPVALRKFFVYINYVPVLHVNTSNVMEIDTSLVLKLDTGKNLVIAYYLAENGIESNYAQASVVYIPPKRATSDLYFVGIAVNEYSDSRLNLRYSKKDILSLDSLFTAQNAGRYHRYMLFDTAVNPLNMVKVKEWLRSARPNDRVVVALSGHGLIGDNLEFYFATSNCGPANPRAGIPYAEIENMFESTNARKRLMILDACHSGEIEKSKPDNKSSGNTGNLSGLLQAGKAKVAEHLSTGGVGLQESFELMRAQFAQVGLGNGIVVLAAARGYQFANEGDEWENGVFTYTILEALKQKEADLNRDNLISISELSHWVAQKVEERTRGSQKPTLRSDIINNDWIIW